jgi:hypothetical protein
VVKYYYLIIGGVLLFKHFLILLSVSVLLSSCAATSSEPKVKEVEAEATQQKELTRIDEIAKMGIVDHQWDEAHKLANVEKGDLPPHEVQVLIEYLYMFKLLNSDKSVEVKNNGIESKMWNLSMEIDEENTAKYTERYSYFGDVVKHINHLNEIYDKRFYEIGMSKDDVLFSMGFPNDINRTVTENSKSEQWVYDNGVYVYLENGVVTSFQD